MRMDGLTARDLAGKRPRMMPYVEQYNSLTMMCPVKQGGEDFCAGDHEAVSR